jgi:hypothetical protein
VATVVAGVLFLAVAVGLLVLLVRERTDTQRLRDEQTAAATVKTTAAQVTEALARWDAGTNQEQRTTLDRLANGVIVTQYDGAKAGLDKALPVFGIQSVQARVKEVYLGEVSNGEAQVVVIFDLVVAGKNPAVIPNRYFRVHLSQIDGTWKVDNAEDVNASLAALGSSGGTTGSTTSTTTPPGAVPTTDTSSPSG